jgi:hypothetical protein
MRLDLFALPLALAPLALAAPMNCTSLHTRSSAITLTLGVNRMNVGDISNAGDRSALYANVYSAFQLACPDPRASSCTGTANFGVRVEKPFIVACKGCFQCTLENIHVSMVSAKWYADPATFYLLVGAVAGSIERGTYPEEHCRHIAVQDNVLHQHRYCNSFDHVNLAFPGGSIWRYCLRGRASLGSLIAGRWGRRRWKG